MESNLEITKRKAERMTREGVKVCMVRDCDGLLDLHELLFFLVCRDCGVVQRRENVLFLRQADRENAHRLRER